MFDFNRIVDALKTDPNMQRTVGSGAAGLAAGMLLGGGGLGSLAKYGAVAAIGGLAYSAWQRSQQTSDTLTSRDPLEPAPEGGPFMPAGDAAQEELGKSLVRAMIAAAKADGRIDSAEKEAIFTRLETMNLSAAEKAFVFDELATPLDMGAVVGAARTPEIAAEIYAASLVAITADTASERAYLDSLAHRLELAPGLVSEIHAAAQQRAPASGG